MLSQNSPPRLGTNSCRLVQAGWKQRIFARFRSAAGIFLRTDADQFFVPWFESAGDP